MSSPIEILGELTPFDIAVMEKRKQIIIRLVEKGKIDPSRFDVLWDMQERVEVIMEERQAFKNMLNNLDDREALYDSPLSRLFAQLLKLKQGTY